jgi:long-chain acyl-CoA synthetase
MEEETVVSAAIYPNIEELQDILKTENVSKEDIQKAVSEAVRDANRKLPNYKKIRSYYISDEEFIKTTTKKIKRQVNIDKIKQNNQNKINT